MKEITLNAERDEEGGITTQGRDLRELQDNVKEAVPPCACFRDDAFLIAGQQGIHTY